MLQAIQTILRGVVNSAPDLALPEHQELKRALNEKVKGVYLTLRRTARQASGLTVRRKASTGTGNEACCIEQSHLHGMTSGCCDCH